MSLPRIQGCPPILSNSMVIRSNGGANTMTTSNPQFLLGFGELRDGELQVRARVSG
jgi:hypothetical protein